MRIGSPVLARMVRSEIRLCRAARGTLTGSGDAPAPVNHARRRAQSPVVPSAGSPWDLVDQGSAKARPEREPGRTLQSDVFLTINSVIRRQRRRMVTLALVLSLAGVVVLAHSAMGEDHMDSGTVMCVAVLQVAALAAVAVAARRPQAVLPVRWSAHRVLGPRLLLLAFPPQPRARAGPAALQIFRL